MAGRQAKGGPDDEEAVSASTVVGRQSQCEFGVVLRRYFVEAGGPEFRMYHGLPRSDLRRIRNRRSRSGPRQGEATVRGNERLKATVPNDARRLHRLAAQVAINAHARFSLSP